MVADLRVVLASRSPRRVEILRELGIDFEVMPADIDETPFDDENPSAYVARLAHDKAFAVAAALQDDAVVIGADTTVDVDGEIFGQPVDAAEAASMLGRLSGRSHLVHTGVCLLRVGTGIALTEVATSTVTFRSLTEGDIRTYLDSGEWVGKAGSYAIQGIGGGLVAGLSGSRTNVIGLPAEVLTELFRALGA